MRILVGSDADANNEYASLALSHANDMVFLESPSTAKLQLRVCFDIQEWTVCRVGLGPCEVQARCSDCSVTPMPDPVVKKSMEVEVTSQKSRGKNFRGGLSIKTSRAPGFDADSSSSASRSISRKTTREESKATFQEKRSGRKAAWKFRPVDGTSWLLEGVHDVEFCVVREEHVTSTMSVHITCDTRCHLSVAARDGSRLPLLKEALLRTVVKRTVSVETLNLFGRLYS